MSYPFSNQNAAWKWEWSHSSISNTIIVGISVGNYCQKYNALRVLNIGSAKVDWCVISADQPTTSFSRALLSENDIRKKQLNSVGFCIFKINIIFLRFSHLYEFYSYHHGEWQLWIGTTLWLYVKFLESGSNFLY